MKRQENEFNLNIKKMENEHEEKMMLLRLQMEMINKGNQQTLSLLMNKPKNDPNMNPQTNDCPEQNQNPVKPNFDGQQYQSYPANNPGYYNDSPNNIHPRSGMPHYDNQYNNYNNSIYNGPYGNSHYNEPYYNQSFNGPHFNNNPYIYQQGPYGNPTPMNEMPIPSNQNRDINYKKPEPNYNGFMNPNHSMNYSGAPPYY